MAKTWSRGRSGARIAIGLTLGLLGLIGVAGWAAWTPDRSVDSLSARWAPPPSRFMTLDGMQVHYRDEGPRGDAMPIVLIHGTASSLQSWEGWVTRLKPTHRVISLDRPGFGLTGPNPTGDYSMTYYAGFMGRFLDRLGVRRAIVAGNSSGGRIAWHLAADDPKRVAFLILLAPAGYPRTTPLPLGLRISMSPVFGPVLAHLLPRAAVRLGLEGSYGDPAKVTPTAVDRAYELTLRAGNRAALGQTLRQAQGSDDAPLIRKVRVPTLILWGTADTIIPPSDAARFHADIVGSTLVLLPGVGHLLQEEDPAGTAEAMLAFLARHTAPPLTRPASNDGLHGGRT